VSTPPEWPKILKRPSMATCHIGFLDPASGEPRADCHNHLATEVTGPGDYWCPSCVYRLVRRHGELIEKREALEARVAELEAAFDEAVRACGGCPTEVCPFGDEGPPDNEACEKHWRKHLLDKARAARAQGGGVDG